MQGALQVPACLSDILGIIPSNLQQKENIEYLKNPSPHEAQMLS